MKIGNSKSLLLTCLLFTLLIMSGCTLTDPYQKSVYNDNAKIAREADSYSFASRVGKTEGNKLDINFSDFYGKQTIWQIAAAEDCILETNVQSDVTGQFKICLVNPDKEVAIISEGTNTEKISLNVPKGANSIAIVGNNASGRVSFTIDVNQKAAIVPYEQLNR